MANDHFPLNLYIYDENGFHSGGIPIFSEDQLNGPGTVLIIRDAVRRGVEVRIADSDDFLVFHANHGKVIFPEEK